MPYTFPYRGAVSNDFTQKVKNYFLLVGALSNTILPELQYRYSITMICTRACKKLWFLWRP